ncbi:hypothetical protein [Foetidibacter luteolus]|uniref:hypothetical protein n=1 Tax=Foetidibacter luteolus TaxID=2608880 RepID=UPI00129B2E59|nr:hypothetical protein [Foetidibacter luteolus]
MKENYANVFMYAAVENEGMNMYYGASSIIFQRATELRNTMTPAEAVLWKAIQYK